VTISSQQTGSGEENYCWLSPAQSLLILGPIETYGHVLFFPDFRCFETRPPFRRQERSDYWFTSRSCLVTTDSALILLRTALDQSVKLPLALPSILILGFESRRDPYPIFLFSLGVYVFLSGASSSKSEWMDRSVSALGMAAPQV
jgi:hypothetical protein